ncbi:MAG: zinc-ribbon and DUF3426 domain-containing protein [Pseudohongiellaceae bacterium]
MSGTDNDFVTRCPSCDRAFHVHASQLKAANGQVRCGSCMSAFDARKHASGAQLTFEVLPDADDDSLRFSALSLDLEDEDSPSLDHDAREQVLSLDQPVNLPAAGARPDRMRQAGAWLLAVLLVIILATQVLWHEHERLSGNPATRPFIAALCERLGCELPPFRDLAALQSTNFSLRSLPGRDNALLLTLTLRNEAAFAQPLPDLDLAFTNPDNRIVAARRFPPDEYLDPGLIESWQQEHGNASLPDLPASGSLDVQLVLADPGEEAVNYELAFSQP